MSKTMIEKIRVNMDRAVEELDQAWDENLYTDSNYMAAYEIIKKYTQNREVSNSEVGWITRAVVERMEHHIGTRG